MFNIRFGLRYLRHRFTANNRHGLHSPFVYRLVDSVIYDFRAKNAYTELKNAYHQHRNDHRLTLPLKAFELLYRLVADAEPQTVIIAETDSPVAARSIRLAVPAAVYYPLESLPKAGSVKADLLYINSQQHTQNLAEVFANYLPYVNERTCVILQNIHQHPANRRAWATIKTHPQVTVTVDLFWLQLVYCRKGQVKEDFRVKY